MAFRVNEGLTISLSFEQSIEIKYILQLVDENIILVS